jgi:K+-sensing histidine kinase KdpD
MNQNPESEFSTDAGIVTFDSRGRVTAFSRGAEKITGWPREMALFQPLDSVFRLSGRTFSFQSLLPLAGRQKQIHVQHHNGEELALMVTCVQLEAEQCDTILVLRDLTEEQAAKNLQSYFLGSISHEFRTPLSALNASVELLLEDLEDLSHVEIAQLLNSIHFSVSGLQTLIDNLLESTSIEAGQFRIRRRRTDLHQVADEALHMMRPLLTRRQQTLTRFIPRQLPVVKVDPTRLTQVLVNLISNASKYSPIGETIELTLRIENQDTLYVMVADHGPGIPPEAREDIFQRYVRLGEKDEAQYGVGLGLSVVKAIVEQHGGQIAVEERLGGGSIFWFTLPLEEIGGELP